MASLHTEYFKIRTSEINHHKLLHPHALIQLMQEASMQHTISMGVSVWDLETMNASWVLLKMDVNVIHYPSLNETVKIITYPSGLDGYFTFRDYYMYNEKGTLCATSSTMWTLLNLDTRKIMKIPERFGSLVYDKGELLEKPAFKLSPFAQPDTSSCIQVNYFHIDWNGHVNNGQLIKLILEQIDSKIHQHKTLKSLFIQFKAEAILDQLLEISNITNDNVIKHMVTDQKTKKEVLLAESVWDILQ